MLVTTGWKAKKENHRESMSYQDSAPILRALTIGTPENALTGIKDLPLVLTCRITEGKFGANDLCCSFFWLLCTAVEISGKPKGHGRY